jgi:hypothetical protein
MLGYILLCVQLCANTPLCLCVRVVYIHFDLNPPPAQRSAERSSSCYIWHTQCGLMCPGSLQHQSSCRSAPQQPAPVYRQAERHFTRATSSLASLSGLPDLIRVERLKMFIAVSSLCLVDEFVAVLHCLLVWCPFVMDTDVRCPEDVTMNCRYQAPCICHDELQMSSALQMSRWTADFRCPADVTMNCIVMMISGAMQFSRWTADIRCSANVTMNCWYQVPCRYHDALQLLR